MFHDYKHNCTNSFLYPDQFHGFIWRFETLNVEIKARLDFVTEANIHVQVFWIVTPCNVAVGLQRFGGSWCFILHP